MDIPIESLRRVDLNPGEVLVVTVPLGLKPSARDRMGNDLAMIFPGNKILVIDDTISLAVVNAADAPIIVAEGK